MQVIIVDNTVIHVPVCSVHLCMGVGYSSPMEFVPTALLDAL